MSSVVVGRVVNYARQVFQNFANRVNIVNRTVQPPLRKEVKTVLPVKYTSRLLHVYKKYAEKSIASGLRQRFSTGTAGAFRSISAFGFVGVTLAGTSFQLNHYDKREDICDLIQSFVKENFEEDDTDLFESVPTVNDFTFGSIIGQGCNAVVYEAKMKTLPVSGSSPTIDDESDEEESFIVLNDDEEEILSTDSDNSFIVIDHTSINGESDDVTDTEDSFIILDESQSDETVSVETSDSFHLTTEKDFDLAVKIIFNYEAESCAAEILSSFQKEALPVRMIDSKLKELWHNGHRSKMKSLPHHPNIVDMKAMFVDDIPLLDGAASEYPLALPTRHNPDGYGRNQTMFLIMKRYDVTLREYLSTHSPDLVESTLLLSQLLEGLVHLNNNKVAHRDLKSNNILLQLSNEGCPHLAICDFGSCLSEGRLRIPYNISDISKGGNAALMAPEIAKTEPGWNSVLDYSKSDIWTAGTIAYELFGQPNPIYRKLSSKTYRMEDLPQLPDLPDNLKNVLNLLLQSDPEQRVTPIQAANMVQIILWGPASWSKPESHPPTRGQILEWLFLLSTEVVLSRGRTDGLIEQQLKQQFLSRANIVDITEAIYILLE